MRSRTPLLAAACAALMLGTALSQRAPRPLSGLGSASHLVVPQLRAMPLDPARAADRVVIEAVRARVELVDLTARTELEVLVRNPSGRAAEGVLLLPVPARAVVSSFGFEGSTAEPSAKLLPREEARALYDSIVARLRDPALLEFAGHDLVRSSVFPVPAGGTQRVRLTYEHLLERVGDRIDYVLPRSQSLDQAAPWSVEVGIRASHAIAMAFSPSHEIVTRRTAPGRMTVRTAAAAARVPGTFRLSFLVQGSADVTASLFAYPDPAVGGGYFLLMAGMPPTEGVARDRVRREVTLVLDRSGSMAGGKLDQVRAAALQVIEGLDDGEGFQIVDYASDVARFAAAPVLKRRETIVEARAYLASLNSGGGTNIHDALVEALRPQPPHSVLPIVLFLTDGLPTVGTTSELAIRALVEQGNPHARRVFTFGVGQDVNAPLLDRIAEVTRATATYVLPEDDVEVKVAQVFRDLYGPVLCDLELATLDTDGAVDTRRVRELQPARLPDLFEDDQLVLFGRYRGDAPLQFRLRGSWFGKSRTFAFRFDLDRASTRNAFVPRLWASRRIAELIDQIRQAGASDGPRRAHDPFADARLSELREEILVLSTRFGILSEYTAFLATEGTDLGDWHALTMSCGRELDQKAMRTRWGAGALNQAANIQAQKTQVALNPRNAFLDERMRRVEVATVQQVCDRAFFRRGARWIDSQLVRDGAFEPDRVVRRGSVEHDALLRELLVEGRNALLSLRGEILLRVGGEKVLVIDRR